VYRAFPLLCTRNRLFWVSLLILHVGRVCLEIITANVKKKCLGEMKCIDTCWWYIIITLLIRVTWYSMDVASSAMFRSFVNSLPTNGSRNWTSTLLEADDTS